MAYVTSERLYVKDILKEAHIEFEQYYQQYCNDYNIPIDELNKKHADKLEKVFPKKQQVDADGLVKTESSEEKRKPVDRTLQKMYRKAATMTHPDKFPDSSSDDAVKASETFKALTSAFNEKKWYDFLDICQKLDILPSTYKKVNEIIKKEIEKTKDETKKLKLSFSWRLFDCDDNNNCKRRVIKDFLFQLFGYSKDKNTIII